MQDTSGGPAAESPEAMRARVLGSFARQAMMATLGAEVTSVTPGRIELALRHDGRFTQQHGFLHAGAVAAVLDSACGYAAFSLMPPDAAVLTASYTHQPARPGRRAAVHGDRPGRAVRADADRVPRRGVHRRGRHAVRDHAGHHDRRLRPGPASSTDQAQPPHPAQIRSIGAVLMLRPCWAVLLTRKGMGAEEVTGLADAGQRGLPDHTRRAFRSRRAAAAS
jgi:uncharacterized protein (TIGR00369 family)